MGNSAEEKSVKPEKLPSPATAYYGPGFAVPPYFNKTVAAGHAPPMYMWGLPQCTMPPYGAPCAAFYAHGGVYAHTGAPIAGTSFSTDTQAKSSGNTDGGMMKKLKEFDGLAFSIGNGHTESAEGQVDQRVSQSAETEGSSDKSNVITAGAGQNGKKRSREGSPNKTDGKIQTQNSMIPSTEVDLFSEKTMDAILPAVNTSEQLVVTTELELNNTCNTNAKPSPTSVSQSCPPMPREALVQNERELKRERRKQSNRESARRSRLRKQAETEDISMRFQALNSENVTLKSDINKLTEISNKLKLENATLLGKLKNAKLRQSDETNLYENDELRMKPNGTVNLLARVNNLGSVDKEDEETETDMYEEKSPRAKLHQLLDAKPRTDAVAAR